MRLPSNFKQTIANTFYDKTITKCTITEVVDDEGWARTHESDTNTTFMGNVRFDNLAQVQQDYGIEDVIDIIITTDEDVANGDILKYDSVYYRVVKAIPYDTHNMIVANRHNEYQSS